MTPSDYNIFTLSESAVVVEFGRAISVELNNKALDLAAALEADPFSGFVEAVPAYASTTVFYDPVAICKQLKPVSEILRKRFRPDFAQLSAKFPDAGRAVPANPPASSGT